MSDEQLDGVSVSADHQDWYRSEVQPVLQQLARTGDAPKVSAAVS